MPLMRCPPGHGIQTYDSTKYQDWGEGEIEVADIHVREALAARWTVVEEAKAEDRPPAARERTHEPPQAAAEHHPALDPAQHSAEPAHHAETRPPPSSDRPRETHSPTGAPPHRTGQR